MPRIIRGELKGEGLRVGIIVSRWNADITEGLLNGALRALIVAGVPEEQIVIVNVPGAFEIGLALETMALKGTFNALIALGCVIRGETTHFEHVSEAAMRAIYDVSLRYKLPVGCGVLTTETVEQAAARSGANDDNKGSEAALAAVEMVSIFSQVQTIL
jgi:6,7-dimethyl-8-ribityllumazine synthase